MRITAIVLAALGLAALATPANAQDAELPYECRGDNGFLWNIEEDRPHLDEDNELIPCEAVVENRVTYVYVDMRYYERYRLPYRWRVYFGGLEWRVYPRHYGSSRYYDRGRLPEYRGVFSGSNRRDRSARDGNRRNDRGDGRGARNERPRWDDNFDRGRGTHRPRDSRRDQVETERRRFRNDGSGESRDTVRRYSRNDRGDGRGARNGRPSWRDNFNRGRDVRPPRERPSRQAERPRSRETERRQSRLRPSERQPRRDRPPRNRRRD